MTNQFLKKAAQAAFLAITLFAIPSVFAQAPTHTVVDPGLITTHQTITPAGMLSVFRGRVHAISFCGTEESLTTLVNEGGALELYRIGAHSNKVEAAYHGAKQSPGNHSLGCTAKSQAALLGIATGVLLVDSGSSRPAVTLSLKAAPATGGSADTDAFQTTARLSGTLGGGSVGSVVLSDDAKHAVLVSTGTNELALVDVEKRSIGEKIRVGIAPFAAALSRDGSVAWVSSMGTAPKSGGISRTTGTGQREDAVGIDARGVALAGNVMRADLKTGQVSDTISAGLHPTALSWDETRNRLYVANSNSDSITVVDTEKHRLLATWDIQPFAARVHGVAPTALALSPDGKKLYAACAGINAVAVINTSTGAVEGLIPTAWYPSSLALNASGTKLAVGTLLGVGSGDLLPGVLDQFRRELPNLQTGITRRYVHSYRGTVQVIDVPDAPQLAQFTEAVAENTHLGLNEVKAPVPEHIPAFAPIEHVVYIVKENRSYDQLFGDLEKGNGDPSLELYGESVTPNHRALARQFVLLDNFYATGGNSGDGHQWVTQAAETEYTIWPAYGGRSYPFDGNDPLAYASGGFLWDAALQARRSFADFGEFIPWGQFPQVQANSEEETRYRSQLLDSPLYRSKLLKQWQAGEEFQAAFNVKSPIPPLDAHLVRDYPSYGPTVPDVVRARIFLRHLKEWETSGEMPNLTFLQLPSDHTAAAAPGYCTPKACVADNDLALGQIVEGLTHSRFWPHMVIFVVEDDAQGGIDHVDGHRTVALVISPYVRRGAIDSTVYSHPSIAKTIEMMLGLKSLSLFDLIARDTRDSFTEKPDFTPYTSLTPEQSLFDVNPPAQALNGQAKADAIASAKMNWSVPDAAPAKKVLNILWRNAKGTDQPVPKQQNAVFLPFAPTDGAEDDDN